MKFRKSDKEVLYELGQKFKQIRKQRKYTIQRLAQVAGSVASISDFENNKTSLSNDTLFKLLKHLKVEYNEFFVQEYLVDETYIKLANQYNQASNHLDFEALEQVAEKFRILGETNYSDYLISLCIDCQVSKLQNRSVNQDIATELQNYFFFSIDIWTLLDIDLLDMVRDIFTEDALKIYIKELLSILGTNPRNNLDRITLDVISRCIFQIILYGNQEDSDYYLNELKTIQLPDYFMLQKLYLKELEAAYLYKFIDKNMGNSLHKEVLHYLAFMGDDDNLREWDQTFCQL
ncbi:MAG: helix-turn-helix domain-containing protein [Streptococcus sp.]|uniref:helix-turn-helix domain-containing protein n=1 Tax=Streptococcus sp. TaxID=1306 RepID=UPI0039928C3F